MQPSESEVSIKKKTAKYVDFFLTKGYLILHQKIFTNGRVHLKYLFRKQKSDKMIVVFSSCTRRGVRARYNYRRTLQNTKCNQLYILDDFAEDGRGSYYIGSDMLFDEEKSVQLLIDKIMKENKIRQVAFCGSSKGGWASINFGLLYENAIIISGGPQYYLGTYLKQSGNLDSLRHIAGVITEDNISKLDFYLRDKIFSNTYKEGQKIHLHFSESDHTFYEHIKFLLMDLEHCGYHVACDVAAYENHSDISYYYPDFLLVVLAEYNF